MLIIRLSRVWRRNLPMYRVVLTEHTKPVKSWYIEILWTYNPIKRDFSIDSERVKELVGNWVQLSERIAKLMYGETQDEIYKKFYVHRELTRATKNPDKYN